MKYTLLQVLIPPSPPPSKEKPVHTKDSKQYILNTMFPPRYVLIRFSPMYSLVTTTQSTELMLF